MFKEVDEREFTCKRKVHNWLKVPEAEQWTFIQEVLFKKIGLKSTSSGSLGSTNPAVANPSGKEPWQRRLNWLRYW